MFIDKVKNFCDHSMILREMAANQKPIGTLKSKKAATNDLFFFVDIKSNSTLIVSHVVPFILSLAVLILPKINS